MDFINAARAEVQELRAQYAFLVERHEQFQVAIHRDLALVMQMQTMMFASSSEANSTTKRLEARMNVGVREVGRLNDSLDNISEKITEMKRKLEDAVQVLLFQWLLAWRQLPVSAREGQGRRRAQGQRQGQEGQIWQDRRSEEVETFGSHRCCVHCIHCFARTGSSVASAVHA